jgi:hypothetical protein
VSELQVTPLRRCKNWETCRGDAHDAPLRGAYANLCSVCRGAAATRRTSAARAPRSVGMGRSLDALTVAARRLEEAVAAEHAATTERHLAISEFNAAIREVNAQAHRVLNAPRKAAARVDERMEREL